MKNPNVWKENEIMKMIGEHSIDEIVNSDVEKVFKAFTELPGTRGELFKTMIEVGHEILFSMYILGKIHGVRAERKNRKKNRG